MTLIRGSRRASSSAISPVLSVLPSLTTMISHSTAAERRAATSSSTAPLTAASSLRPGTMTQRDISSRGSRVMGTSSWGRAAHLSSEVMNLNSGTGSTDSRLQTIRTARAPTAFPTKPTTSIGYPAATQGEVMAR